jgi:hypothetical protein
MTLPNRFAKIKDRATGPRPVWDERSAIEANTKPVVVQDMEADRAIRQARTLKALRDRRIVFVDFCPGGVVMNRQDVGWIQQGICTYEFFANDEQFEMFQSISIGDLLVMKKTQQSTKSMRLHAYGRVFGFDLSENRDRILLVNWTHEQGQIEVPLMESEDMVSIHDILSVQAGMPLEFWDWLKA